MTVDSALRTLAPCYRVVENPPRLLTYKGLKKPCDAACRAVFDAAVQRSRASYRNINFAVSTPATLQYITLNQHKPLENHILGGLLADTASD